MRLELQTTIKFGPTRWSGMKSHFRSSVKYFIAKMSERKVRRFPNNAFNERYKQTEDFRERKCKAINEYNNGRVFFFIDNQVNW